LADGDGPTNIQNSPWIPLHTGAKETNGFNACSIHIVWSIRPASETKISPLRTTSRHLPKPAGTSTDPKLNIPPPSLTIKATKVVSAEPKRDTKPVEPVAASEPKIVVQTPTIQLAPRISDREKNDFVKKINDQLDSARSLIKSVNEASLGEQQKINLEAIQDFIKKSEDAVTRRIHSGSCSGRR
jgi:hypothetical protein